MAKIDKPVLGEAKRIDLQVPWPFDRQQLNIVHALPMDLEDWVLITLEPRQGRTGLEERMVPIYSVYLDPVEGQEAGLVLRKFKTDSPYSDSELLVAPTGEIIRCDKNTFSPWTNHLRAFLAGHPRRHGAGAILASTARRMEGH